MAHEHNHQHKEHDHHHHGVVELTNVSKAFIVGIILNMVYVIIQVVIVFVSIHWHYYPMQGIIF